MLSWSRFRHGVNTVFNGSFRKALDNKIDFRFIIEKPPSSRSIMNKELNAYQKYPNFKVRFIPYHPKTVFGIYDEKELFIIVDPKVDLPRCSPALWTNNRSIIALILDYFDSIWKTAATKLEDAKT